MCELKKIGKVFTSKFAGTGLSSYKKRIYQAAVSQMRNAAVEPGRPQIKIWRIRISCWIPKATNTHSQYIILIAFPLQQWLQELASILRYTDIL